MNGRSLGGEMQPHTPLKFGSKKCLHRMPNGSYCRSWANSSGLCPSHLRQSQSSKTTKPPVQRRQGKEE